MSRSFQRAPIRNWELETCLNMCGHIFFVIVVPYIESFVFIFQKWESSFMVKFSLLNRVKRSSLKMKFCISLVTILLIIGYLHFGSGVDGAEAKKKGPKVTQKVNI